MSTIRKCAQRATFYLIAVLMGLSLFAPIVALGQGNLNAGDTATISTGGGDATLRDSASSSGASIGSIPNGTKVYIVDGPITDSDGSMWYQAGIWDITGYITSTLLEGDSVGSSAPVEAAEEDTAPTEEESSTVIPWEQPVDYGVVVDNSNAPLPGDGLACRADAFGAADVIVRFSQGQSVEVTGAEQWAEGLAFLPVNCGGQGGFVKADYVALNSEPTAEVVEEVVDEPVAAADDVVEEVDAEDAATDEPVADAPSAGDVIIRVIDENGMAVAGLCFQLYQAGTWVADACDSTDAIPDNGNSGFFGIPSGGYTLVASTIPGGQLVNDREVAIVAGETESVGVTLNTVAEPEVVETDEPVEVDEVVETDEPVAARLDLSRAIGDATVTGTQGEGVRCRIAPDNSSATIMVLPEDATVFVLAEPVDGYIQVACGDQIGYADVNYMIALGAGDEIPSSASSVVVIGTGGMSLNCRSGAGSNFGGLTSVPQGSVLTSRGASSNGWAPVVCNGLNGFVSISFVEVSGSTSGSGTNTGSLTGTGTITNT
ncbi:MAG: hypothetical protein M3490_13065, partial [Chloroflexota bacterium]|nr:hypothetical protein [Chloroflexota bacterium]